MVGPRFWRLRQLLYMVVPNSSSWRWSFMLIRIACLMICPLWLLLLLMERCFFYLPFRHGVIARGFSRIICSFKWKTQLFRGRFLLIPALNIIPMIEDHELVEVINMSSFFSVGKQVVAFSILDLVIDAWSIFLALAMVLILCRVLIN